MKRIIFSALWLLIITAPSCNDDKTKGKDKNNIVAVDGPGARQPQQTIDTLTKVYPVFTDSLRESVKFIYKDFKDSAAKMQTKEVYLVYGAYTPDDVSRYLSTHPKISKTDSALYVNRPCLLVGFKDASSKFSYSDFGTLCPPPGSCETFFMFPEKMKVTHLTALNPNATISNYFATYDKNPANHLTTTMMKFNIDSITSYVDSLNKLNKPLANATDIYFQFGAFTAQDTSKYFSDKRGPATAPILGKPYLLFVYKDANKANIKYLDFGIVYPPGN